jgi:hypothetical protein
MKAAVLHRYDTALTEPDFVVLEEVPELNSSMTRTFSYELGEPACAVPTFVSAKLTTRFMT